MVGPEIVAVTPEAISNTLRECTPLTTRALSLGPSVVRFLLMTMATLVNGVGHEDGLDSPAEATVSYEAASANL
jgi:cobalamin synthase